MKFEISAILFLSSLTLGLSKSIDIQKLKEDNINDIENDIIDFDDEYSVKYDKKYEVLPWTPGDFKKDTYKYTIIKEEKIKEKNEYTDTSRTTLDSVTDNIQKTTELSVIPLELLSTTEGLSVSVTDHTPEPDLTVIPLRTTQKIPLEIIFNETVTFPSSTEVSEDFNSTTVFYEMTTKTINLTDTIDSSTIISTTNDKYILESDTDDPFITQEDATESYIIVNNETNILGKTLSNANNNNDTIVDETDSVASNEEVPVFTELDTENLTEVPEDYYDSKDIVPTPTPKTDTLSVIFGFAGSVVESVVESVAERVVPKGLYDLFKRMQRQNELLEAEKLRSREENGGIGQFTRGVIKTISTGLSRPFSQLMAGVRDIGSLDSDRGFINSLASGVTSVANVANSMVDVFKDRVEAIYPGTIWCGDGHSAQARSSDLGLFFFTDTCCRQHDACKMYVLAGETKFGLTNTGLFTRSHCSCDAKFRECLRKTNSLVSAQIGLTYFNVLGPQCFRKAHPIVRCVRRTRITGLKCEEYELDYSKPKMWQWFDNETY